jgi:hypothetical protein
MDHALRIGLASMGLLHQVPRYVIALDGEPTVGLVYVKGGFCQWFTPSCISCRVLLSNCAGHLIALAELLAENDNIAIAVGDAHLTHTVFLCFRRTGDGHVLLLKFAVQGIHRINPKEASQDRLGVAAPCHSMTLIPSRLTRPNHSSAESD